MEKKSWLNENFASVLGLLTAVSFFAVIMVTLYHEVPQGSHDVAVGMTQVLATSFGVVIGYQWGSSRGSAVKTDIMAAQAKDSTGGKP